MQYCKNALVICFQISKFRVFVAFHFFSRYCIIHIYECQDLLICLSIVTSCIFSALQLIMNIKIHFVANICKKSKNLHNIFHINGLLCLKFKTNLWLQLNLNENNCSKENTMLLQCFSRLVLSTLINFINVYLCYLLISIIEVTLLLINYTHH
jgi:hypothetical protein